MAFVVVAASALLTQACSTGETPQNPDAKVKIDKGGPDLPKPDVGVDSGQPDVLPADLLPKDTLSPDTLSPDMGPCGNGQIDPGENCDPAIKAGDPGACPADVSECDDLNTCTTDSLTGQASDCSATCVNAPITPCCGNGIKEGTEVCDDGNQVDKDGCNNTCNLPGGHLLLTEFATSPSEAEFIEIYNPSTSPVPLKDVYLSDRFDYFQIVDPAAVAGGSTDFIVRFPDGAVLNAGEYAVVAFKSLGFKTVYGKAPDYEIVSGDSAVPDMVPATNKSLGSQAGLTDSGELLVLFRWDGLTDLVQDIDYVVWKGASATAVSKNTTICMDGPDGTGVTACSDVPNPCTCYLDDTNVIAQSSLNPPQQGGSLHRCNYLETGEKATGGNGETGHDETSEPFDGAGATWKRNPKTLWWRTPGKPAPPKFCPQ